MASIPKKTRKYNTKKKNRSTIKLNKIHLKKNCKGDAFAQLIKDKDIKGIIFDKDGTLINSEEWLRKSINLALNDIINNGNKEIIKFIIEGKDAFVRAQGAVESTKTQTELYTVENHMDTVSMSKSHNFDENLKQLLEKHNLLNPNASKDYKKDYVEFFKTKYRHYQTQLKILELTSNNLLQNIEALKHVKLAINSSGSIDKYNENLKIPSIRTLFSHFDFVLLEDKLIDHRNGNTAEVNTHTKNDKTITINAIKKKPDPDTYTFIAKSLFDVNKMDKIIVVEDTAKGALAAIRAKVGLIIINTNGELDLVQRKFLEYSNDIKDYIQSKKLIFVENLDTLCEVISNHF